MAAWAVPAASSKHNNNNSAVLNVWQDIKHVINDDRLELECVPTRVARALQLCVAVVCATAAAVDVYVALAACLLAAACLILCAILCEVLSAAWL